MEGFIILNYNNPYHAVVELIYEDIKKATKREIDKWHRSHIRELDLSKIRGLEELLRKSMDPMRFVPFEWARLTLISVRDDAHIDLLNLEGYDA